MISSDFVPQDNETIQWVRDSNVHYEDMWYETGLGEVSEIIVHDVKKLRTTIIPFRCIQDAADRPMSRLRDNLMFDWRSEEGEVIRSSYSYAEFKIEGCDWPKSFGKRAEKNSAKTMSQGIAPGKAIEEFPAENYEGILDRVGIREKRIADGTAKWRYLTPEL
jgi:hypothetical protein